MAVKSRQALRTGPVTASQALRIGRRFGVTLDLSNDIELAGKWKHGWIPLDAVAAAVKAKRYHGGATHELTTHSGSIHVRNVRDDANNRNMSVATVVKDHRQGVTNLHAPGANVWVARAQVHPLSGGGGEVRGKARGGSLVESMRRPSVGRSKTAPPVQAEARSTWRVGNNGSGKRMHFLISSDEKLPVDQRYHYGSGGRLVRFSSYEAGKRAADRLHAQGRFPGASANVSRETSGPRRRPHIAAEPLKDGRHKLTDSKTGESVKAAHLASFHNQGHTITGVQDGLVHTRDDYGRRHVYDPATGRAAVTPATRRAQQTAQDRTRRLQNAQVARDEAAHRAAQQAKPRGLRAKFDAETDPAKKAALARQIARSKKRPGDKMMWGMIALQEERKGKQG